MYATGNALVFANVLNGRQDHLWTTNAGSITAYAINKKRGYFALAEFGLKPKVSRNKIKHHD